jgi:glycine dehydrogenase subunit 2
MEAQTLNTRKRASSEERDRSADQKPRVNLLTNKLGHLISPEEATLFDLSSSGREGYSLPSLDIPAVKVDQVLPKEEIRSEITDFPELSENEVVRHFTRLSQKNYNIDTGFYPLGSCTMKYNPKINEEVARIPELSSEHPFWPEEFLQPALAIQFQLQELLSIVSGFDAFTLQPNAGAQGEYTGLKMIRAYHRKKGNKKTKILVPDSAHGTNPATCTMVGYEAVSLPTGPNGIVELDDIKPLITDDIAGIMITNPNTLGLFEEHLPEICKLIHKVDGLVYMDGANFNAVLGICRPADLGVDIMHINTHKTFSTPHGGGGPGAGPVGVKAHLKDFLPCPTLVQTNEGFGFNYDMPDSIGKVSGYYGNFSIHLRALAYLLSNGTTSDGKDTYLKQMSEAAVLNANYIRHRLKDYFDIPYGRDACMHEVVLSDHLQEEFGVKTANIAKRLMDYGFHPMTVYFPLIVHGAMMIEPTESESKETLDEFCDAMISIAKECKENPELVLTAPLKVNRKKIDELKAQKEPKLRWTK